MKTLINKRVREVLFLIFFLHIPTAFSEAFTATFIDNTSRQPIANTKIVAKLKQADGSYAWAQRKDTDQVGNAEFDLDFSQGQEYLLEIEVFNDLASNFTGITQAQNMTLFVGKQNILLLDGTTNSTEPLANYDVRIEQYQDTGQTLVVHRLFTDDAGHLRLDLREGSYRLRARSPISGKWVYSEDFTEQSSLTVKVGELPLQLKVVNAQTQEPIPNEEITAFILDEHNQPQWFGKDSTDSNGELIWELAGLEQGRRFLLSSQFLGLGSLKSEVLVDTWGQLEWQIGRISITLNDATQSPVKPLANYETVLKKEINGSLTHVKNLNTNSMGIVTFDLSDISSQNPYVLEAKSPTDASTIYSKTIVTQGTQQFNVGSEPLNLQLINAQTKLPLSNVKINIREVTNSDETSTIGNQITDANGNIAIDYSDFSAGNKLQLATNFLNNSWSLSELFDGPGSYQWEIGSIKIQVLDGTTGSTSALANHEVQFRYQDGQFSRIEKRVNSDEEGIIFVDLDGISVEKPFLLRAVSPNDGVTQFEQWIDSTGAYEFVVGNAPVEVNLTHAQTGAALEDKLLWLTKFTGVDSDGVSQYERIKLTQTDENGLAKFFDITDLNGDTTYAIEVIALNNFSFYSEHFNQESVLNLSAGKIQVTLKDGSKVDNPPLINHRLSIRRYDTDGSYMRISGTFTNSEGVAEIDLPTLEAGQSYRLVAQSLSDQKYKVSEPIAISGNFEFVVGNEPVIAEVKDLYTQQVSINTKVVAQHFTSDETWEFYANAYTNEEGVVEFDLDGIGEGQKYRFKVTEYSGSIYSQDITEPGESLTLEIGRVPVTLTDSETGLPLANIRINGLVLENNTTSYVTHGITDSNGVAIFDFNHFTNNTYVLRAIQPYPEVNGIYSPYIRSIGHVDFQISETDDKTLDTNAPTIDILSPQESLVSEQGFILAGTAFDDIKMGKVLIEVWDDSQFYELDAQLSATGAWQAVIQSAWLNLDSQIFVSATAYDYVGNRSNTITSDYAVIKDDVAPNLEILSHKNDDAVSANGVTISGTANDNIQVSSVNVTISDAQTGSELSDSPAVFDLQTGQWAIYLNSQMLNEVTNLAVQVVANDASNNSTPVDLTLNVQILSGEVQQLLNRATFGKTSKLEAEILQLGAQTWLEKQLSPENIDDSELDSQLIDLSIDNLNDLKQRELTYAIYSERQLQQVMAWFWENHFSTAFNSHNNISFEEAENRLFRQHALGNFNDLVLVSAKSPAMLRYLDNQTSEASGINENYARELMELHILGVEGGYTDDDVDALARILTGWRSNGEGFVFSNYRHDKTDKLFLGQLYTDNGVQEGEDAIAFMTQQEATALFICGKLINYFVSEENLETLQHQCADVFSSNVGEITPVLRVIFNSAEFAEQGQIASKVKSPLEMYVSAIRALDATPYYEEAISILDNLGMPLFQNPAPDGFGDEAADWINVDAMLQRTKFGLRLAFESDGAEVQLLKHLQSRGIVTPEAIIEYLFNLMLNATNNGIEKQQALDILNQSEAFSIDSTDAPIKLKRLLASIIAYPGFQYQ